MHIDGKREVTSNSEEGTPFEEVQKSEDYVRANLNVKELFGQVNQYGKNLQQPQQAQEYTCPGCRGGVENSLQSKRAHLAGQRVNSYIVE